MKRRAGRLGSNKWYVCSDASGHHRAVPDYYIIRSGEQIVGKLRPYQTVCAEAMKLNNVAAVMKS